MPALGMAQETGKLIRWLKHEGDTVVKGEPVMEIETDKVTVEIEATDSGTLSGISAREGDVVPVGQTIAWILAPDESTMVESVTVPLTVEPTATLASPLARKIAAEHGIDLALVRQDGRRIEKAEVLAYLEKQPFSLALPQAIANSVTTTRLSAASPKARRLAVERGIDLGHVSGSGPVGAVLAADVSAVLPQTPIVTVTSTMPQPADVESLSHAWRVMAERMTTSWTSVPHFYLIREVAAQGLVDMRARITPAIEKRSGIKPTYIDLLVKLAATPCVIIPV